MARARQYETYFPAAPLQELIRQRIREAETAQKVTLLLGINHTTLNRVLRQKRVTMTIADRWSIKLGSTLAVLYPDEY